MDLTPVMSATITVIMSTEHRSQYSAILSDEQILTRSPLLGRTGHESPCAQATLSFHRSLRERYLLEIKSLFPSRGMTPLFAVAHRVIMDELNLDGNPSMNMASFVTTYMEPEAKGNFFTTC